jgi:ATP diphosphatase
MNTNINKLLDTMAQLRQPSGCPWDIKQTFDSLASYTIEEAYEVVDAIEQQDYPHLKEELGDLLFQVVFYAQIASEKGLFNFDDIVTGINKKLIDRHPHVFAKQHNNLTEQQQSLRWEQNKREQNQKNGSNSVLDDIPENLPELLRSVKLTKRAAVIGFDWSSILPVFEKMNEEIAELKQAMTTGLSHRIKDELGDVFFVCTNLARHLKIDPLLALRHANKKFETRFRAVEKLAQHQQPDLNFYDLTMLEQLWIEVKNKNKVHE